MALEGNLTDFGLSEILQLIAIQQKSGMLSIQAQDKAMVLFFRNGKIISTRDRRRKSKDPLKDYLIRYGILTRNDLIRIMTISSQSKLDLTEIIVSEQFLSEEEMKRHVRNHIQEALHEVLTWQQCNYKFIPGNDIIAGLKTWGEYSIEGLLMESMRRIDELPHMLKEFPDKTMVISRIPDVAPQIQLGDNERVLWTLLEEKRSLFYLIAHAGMPGFETYEALKLLSEKTLITKHLAAPQDEQPETAPHTAPRAAGQSRKRYVPLAVLSVLFAVSLGIGARGIASHRAAGSSAAETAAGGVSLERSRIEENLRVLLECYRATAGAYPQSLQSLEDSGLAPRSLLHRAERFSIRYHLTPHHDAYTLL